jgi:hypothetical protein
VTTPADTSLFISRRGDFDQFFRHLTSAERKPVVALTIREGDSRPMLPLEAIREQVGDAADVYVLSSDATFWLTGQLESRALSIYSGWGRVYPPNPEWMSNTQLSPRFSPLLRDQRQTVDQIVSAVLAAAYKGGAYSSRPPVSGGVETDAVVMGTPSPTQALVKTKNGVAVMPVSSLVAGIPADRLVRKNQVFSGRLVQADGNLWGEFTPDLVADNVTGRVAEFVGEGIVTLARVGSVTRDTVRAQLHPLVTIVISGKPGEDLSRLTHEDDVIAVEVVPDGDSYISDFSAEEPAPAMAVLPGGPPWLMPAEVQELPAEPEAVVEMEPAAELSADAQMALEELEHVGQQLRIAEQKVAELQRDLRQSRKLTIPLVFGDAEKQLRLELWLAYLTTVPESDREKYPWPPRFRIGLEFLESVDRLVRDGGITRERIVTVCAEVLCVLANDLPARAVKPWAQPPDGRAETRLDGATAMRVRLQVGSHAARRLKYWRLLTGEIELDRVTVHDDGI